MVFGAALEPKFLSSQIISELTLFPHLVFSMPNLFLKLPIGALPLFWGIEPFYIIIRWSS